jgi:hypothetical protein
MALVPYAVAVLRGNECGLRVTAPPMPSREAAQALRSAWDDVGDNEVWPHSSLGYFTSAEFHHQEIAASVQARVDAAVHRAFASGPLHHISGSRGSFSSS